MRPSLYFMICLPALAGCGEDGPEYYSRASRTEYRGVHVLRLSGTPLEMGLQHGELMADVLSDGVDFVENDPLFSMFMPMAESLGLVDDALELSYPEILDECRGMSEAARRAGTDGWEEETCVALAYGDVILTFVGDLLGCTQFAAAGAATVGGKLIHGRSMDWDELDYLVNHPAVIVRRPAGRIPFVSIGFPGCVAPYNGINARGIAVASNANNGDPEKAPNQRGTRGYTQMIHKILSTCSTLDEVEEFLSAQSRPSAITFVVSDAENRTAAVFEMTSNAMGIRRMDADGVVYATNHFIHPDMEGLHKPKDPDDSSVCRLRRLDELLPPDGRESLHGRIDAELAVSVLRDRYNPCTGQTQPEDAFDDDGSIGTNGAIWSMVFSPEDRAFYLAAGQIPVPRNAYIGFDLDRLLQDTNDFAPDPPAYE